MNKANKSSDIGTYQSSLVSEYQKTIKNASSQCTRNNHQKLTKPFLSKIPFSTYEDIFGQSKGNAMHTYHALYSHSVKHLKSFKFKRKLDKDVELPQILANTTIKLGSSYDFSKTANRFFSSPKSPLRIPIKNVSIKDASLTKTFLNVKSSVKPQPNPSLLLTKHNIFKKVFAYLSEKKIAYYHIK